MIGTFGQLLVLVAALGSVAAALSYGFSSLRTGRRKSHVLGRASWGVVVFASTAAFVLLAILLYTRQYQVAYVYEHVSNDLPWYYLLAALWEGQEGSFLLWIFYTALFGLALIAWTPRDYEGPVMTVVAVCQLFLISMIAGLPVGPIEIGASPFSSLAEAFPEAPIFRANPDFVPADGQGLNELLKSYWMVVHPPMLFLGFGAMTVPFAFSIAALWKRDYTRWVRLALPWMLLALGILGLAIALGGYWAYETLSFGGYWAWDPVENASLVPWIVGVAALHAMLIQKESGRGHKAALVLTIVAYMLVVYESFLTRSGILGDVSVHSFVDLGLYNQLLIWMAVIAAGGVGLFAWRYDELPTPAQESNTLSREFLMFCGVVLLTAVATVIIVGTSSPILGQIFRDQPSAVPVEFYDSWTLPLAIGIAFLAALGQLVWWEEMSVSRVDRSVRWPIGLATISTAGVLVGSPFVTRTVRTGIVDEVVNSAGGQADLMAWFEQMWPVYGQSLLLLLLVFVSFFALFGNAQVLWRIGRGNPRMAGGAVAHVGFALMLLGIVTSAGMSDSLEVRTQDGRTRDYLVLRRGETRTVEGYRMRYVGRKRTSTGRTAYTLDVRGPNGRSFRLNPIAYKSGEQWFQHPAIETFLATDLYTSVAPRAMQVDLESEEQVNTGDEKGGKLTMAVGDSTLIGGGTYSLEMRGFDTKVPRSRVPDSAQVAVAAQLELTELNTGRTQRLSPIYVVMQDRSQRYVQNRLPEWDLTVTFAGMDVPTAASENRRGKAHIVVEGVEVSAEDWIVVRASVKPFINIFWLGILVLTAGFGWVFLRRLREARISLRRWELR